MKIHSRRCNMLPALPFAAWNSDGRALLFLPLLAILAGCGIYHYDYNVTPSLTGKPGKTTVAIVGVDDRNRENPGRFKPEYVGLFRDIMFAIPEFIHNKDKKPIADALANDVALGLTQSGYRATSVPNPSIESPQSALSAARQSSPSRILLVRVNKFESDSQISAPSSATTSPLRFTTPKAASNRQIAPLRSS